jgi:hypothetical protein
LLFLTKICKYMTLVESHKLVTKVNGGWLTITLVTFTW